MDDLSLSNGIPPTLKPFFQDIEFESLDPECHAPTIIERTLSEGNVEEIRWLFARYGVERIGEWIRQRGALRLPQDRCALWHILFGLTPTPFCIPHSAFLILHSALRIPMAALTAF